MLDTMWASTHDSLLPILLRKPRLSLLHRCANPLFDHCFIALMKLQLNLKILGSRLAATDTDASDHLAPSVSPTRLGKLQNEPGFV